MRKVKRKILLLTVLVLILFSLISVNSTNTAHASSNIPKGSTIGGVDVGGMSVKEAQEVLIEHIENWKSEDKVVIETPSIVCTIPYENIHFDIKKSVDELVVQVKKPWYAFFTKRKALHLPILVSVKLDDPEFTNLGNSIDLDKTIEMVETEISYLGSHTIPAVETKSASTTETIAETSWEIPNPSYFLDELIQKMNGIEISTEQPFSFIDQIANEVSYYSEEEGNFLASMLYSLLLQTNVQMIERHSQGEIPRYSEPGIEAKVSIQDGKDFVVKNPGPNIYEISITQTGNSVTMSLLSGEQKTKYHYVIENRKVVDFRTIERFNKELQPGHRQVLQPGEKGERVEVYRVASENGQELERELISRDLYLPKPEIVLLAPKATDENSDMDDNLAGDGNENGTDTNKNELGDDELTREKSGNNSTVNRSNSQSNGAETKETTGEELYDQPNIEK